MAKLGTHLTPPGSASRVTTPPRRHSGGLRCTVCGQPARHRCRRCTLLICSEHTLNQPLMHWEHRYAAGWYPADAWRRYVSQGTFRVCPHCARIMAVRDARELAADRIETRERRVRGATVLLILLIVSGLVIVRDIGSVRTSIPTGPRIVAPR